MSMQSRTISRKQRLKRSKQIKTSILILLTILFAIALTDKLALIEKQQEDTLNTIHDMRLEIDDLRQKNQEPEQSVIEEVNNETALYSKYANKLDEDLIDYTVATSKEFGVDPKLVMAVMETESNFKPDAISSTGDYGLMQINEINHSWLSKDLGVTDFLDPKQSILSGIYMLANIQEEDTHKKLMIYSHGSRGAERQWNKGIYQSRYSIKVLENMQNE